jgi:iron-sulfur cluster assembly protein
MVTVSESAANKLTSLIKESEFKTPYVRVAVKGGGCSGLSYDLSFDTQQNSDDTLAEDKGVKILIDKKSLLYLIGTELNYSDGLNGKGFEWINPNASRTCGCGESFSL